MQWSALQRQIVINLLIAIIASVSVYLYMKQPLYREFSEIREDCSRQSSSIPVNTDKSTLDCSAVIARVAGKTITENEFIQYMNKRSGGFANQFVTLDKKMKLLDELIAEKLQLVHAIEAGYGNDPKIIATTERLIVNLFRQENLQQLLEKISVNDEEIQNYYQQHIEDYKTPALVKGAIIQFKVSALASDEHRNKVKQKAEKILQLAESIPEAVAGFGSLAAQNSTDQATRYVGGNIGWINPQNKDQEYDRAVINALTLLNNKGEVSPVVDASDGYYLVRLTDKKPQQVPPLSKFSQKIKNRLLHQKRKKVVNNWLVSLRTKDTSVEINTALLKNIEQPEGKLARKQQLKPPLLP